MEYIILFYDTSATLVPGGIDIMGKGRGAGFADVRDPILINFQHLATVQRARPGSILEHLGLIQTLLALCTPFSPPLSSSRDCNPDGSLPDEFSVDFCPLPTEEILR